MLRKITLLILLVGLAFGPVAAQESWSLEKCIQHAQQNNLAVKQAQYQVSNAELTLKGAKYSRLPSLNGSLSGVLQFGRTIDPTTNSFDNQEIFSNRLSLDASVILYNGNRINNQIKQGEMDLAAAKLDIEATINDISLNIAAAYLNILLAEEQLGIASKAKEQSEKQLEQTDKLIQAGSLPVNDRLDILAQIAQNEQTIIDAQNLVISNYLNLKQLLEIDPNTDLVIQRPNVEVPDDMDPALYQLESIYTTALGNQPQILAGDIRLKSAALEEDIAFSGLLPRISLFGSINSNYSSLARDFANPDRSNETQVLGPPTTVVIDGNELDVAFFQTVGTVFPDKQYFDQINENLGQTIGLSINIPIYNNHVNRIAMERARINVLNTQVINKQAKNTLKTNIQRAIADARSAKESWEAANRSVEAAQAAFENAGKRFELGAINNLEYTTSRNTLDRAKLDLVRSKFQYIFNLKIVDFYMGKTITID